MMRQTAGFGYARVDGATLLEMPYVGATFGSDGKPNGGLTMVIALPDRGPTTDLEARLSAETLATWATALRPTPHVAVTLPRFRIATDALALKQPLQTLGLTNAFEPVADFSGMTRDERLFISNAFHKVFVEVNEEGTEAAAATAVVMTRESAVQGPEFRADHPFLFLLRDAATGHVLFMGRVVNPNA